MVIGGAAGHLNDLLDFEGGLNHVVRVLLLLVDWGCLSLRWGDHPLHDQLMAFSKQGRRNVGNVSISRADIAKLGFERTGKIQERERTRCEWTDSVLDLPFLSLPQGV